VINRQILSAHQQDHQHYGHEQQPEDQKERQEHGQPDDPATATAVPHKKDRQEENNSTKKIPYDLILLFDSVSPHGFVDVVCHLRDFLWRL
jgi:hypothetical protein